MDLGELSTSVTVTNSQGFQIGSHNTQIRAILTGLYRTAGRETLEVKPAWYPPAGEE